MTFLYSILIAILFVGLFRNQVKKRPIPFYIISILMSLAACALVWFGGNFPPFVLNIIIPIIARGGLAGAFFVIVMITGALPNKSRLIKILMPIRGELSIIASILSLGHNLAYGKTYFVSLIFHSSTMPLTQQLAACCSILMILIMLPLFITSFKSVRRKMKGKTWKKLQRLSYLFYALLAAHIMLLCIPNALNGKKEYLLTVTIYGIIFISYILCRILKAAKLDKTINLRKLDISCVLLLSICITFFAVFFNNSKNTLAANSNALITKDKDVGFSEMLASLKDGKYIGKAMGNNDSITVEVEIISNNIVSVNVLNQMEDEEYWSEAVTIIDSIVVSNSIDVDAVTGATYSSSGIKNAVLNAIKAGFQQLFIYHYQ